MKTFFASFFASLLLVLVSTMAMQAQSINVNPNILKPGLNTNPGLNPCLLKPDLHFTNFTTLHVTPGAIEGTGAYQTRRYTVAFTAVVKNSGGAASVATKVLGEFSRNDQNDFFWGGCMDFAPLAAGATRTIQSVINIRVPVSHNKAKVRMFVDAPCEEEFLPAYVRVNECKENNNLSNVITVTLF